MTRRDLLRLLLAAPLAATVDVEQLMWVPKPIVTVPAMPFVHEFKWREYSVPFGYDKKLLAIMFEYRNQLEKMMARANEEMYAVLRSDLYCVRPKVGTVLDGRGTVRSL